MARMIDDDDEDRAFLEIMREGLAKSFQTQVRRAEAIFKGIQLILILLGGALATVGGLIDTPPESSWDYMGAIGVAGALMALAGGLILRFAEKGVPEQLNDARQAVDAAQRFLSERERLASEISEMRQLDGKRRNLIAAHVVMRQVVEQAIVEPSSCERSMKNLLDLAQRPMVAAMNFQADERYTISIYRKKWDLAGEEVLERVLVRRADRAAERSEGRTWKRGEGFTGTAWQRDKDILVSDVTDDVVEAAFHVPEDKQRDDDGVFYKSIAVFPLRVGGENEIWGVLTVTSDRVGRFTNQADDQNVEAARALAGMLALLAGCEYIQSRA